VDREKQLRGGALISAGDTLIGFGPGGSVVTYVSAKHQVSIHGLTHGGSSGTLAVSGYDWTAGLVDGHRLSIDTGDLRQAFDLRPETQFRTLCSAAGRDYTAAERKLLPEGAPSKPPCQAVSSPPLPRPVELARGRVEMVTVLRDLAMGSLPNS
jgi:hypothetical protein